MSPRILILEDEVLLAMDLSDQLETAGFRVIGPATTVARALRLIEAEGCDAALLDVNLGPETSEAVADVLLAKGTPFIVLSGNSRDHQPAIFQGAPWLPKPFSPEGLMSLLRSCLHGDRRSA